MNTHPSFIRAARLPEPLRSFFPTSPEQAATWLPQVRYRPLSSRVLVVAVTRIECAWRAYVDAVPGMAHRSEYQAVLDLGAPLSEELALVLFPEFKGVPYAD